jgi:RimJ/RimL family protein N-acetyltransferase
MEYINTLSREQTFITLQGEQKTLEEEEGWLSRVMEGLASGKQVYLLAVLDDRVVGLTGVSLQGRVEAHIGKLGISVAADFRDQGLGSVLFQLVNQLADQHLVGLRLVVLGVFGNNHRAYHLYQKFGFMECGRRPGGVCHRGQYVDHVEMFRPVVTG